MFCEQKTPVQMSKDSELATKNALNDLKMQITNNGLSNSSLDVEVSTDTISCDDNNFQFEESSDDGSIQEEIVLRKSGTKQKHHKKENSMIFMFSKYEKVQKKNRAYKTKIVKLENKLSKLEERDHYKNLDLNNTKIHMSELQDKIKELQTKLKSAKKDLLWNSMIFVSIYSLSLFVLLQSNQKMFSLFSS